MTHKIHKFLPSGFAYANHIQREEFADSGSVHGASKVCLVGGEEGLSPFLTNLAVRLRPPRKWDDVVSPVARRHAGLTGFVSSDDNDEAHRWYIREYNNGWQAGSRESKAFDSGMTSAAWDDGYIDRVAGRQKWHLTYCADHGACGEA